MTANKKKILYLVLEMDLGGLQRIVNLLIRKIDKSEFIPYLCCLDRGGIFLEQLEKELSGTYVLKRKPGLFDFGLFLQIIKIIKENKIEIIHSHNGCSFYAGLAGKIVGVKNILHTDHGRLVPDRKGAMIEDRIASLLLNKYVGVSEELTHYLENSIKINRKKLVTVINGVDANRFVPISLETNEEYRKSLALDKDDIILGAVCRLDPIKNIEFLIECLPDIVQQVPEVKVLVVGDGPSKLQLMDEAKKHDVSSNITFLGQRKDVEKILAVVDIYISTSLSEGTSMTILEAMSCGKPIVASAVGGNQKLVDEQNGELFPLNDKDMFTEKVLELCKDRKLREKKGVKSREYVIKKYSLDQMVEQYQELYRRNS